MLIVQLEDLLTKGVQGIYTLLNTKKELFSSSSTSFRRYHAIPKFMRFRKGKLRSSLQVTH